MAGFGALATIGANNQFARNDAGQIVFAANNGADDALIFQPSERP